MGLRLGVSSGCSVSGVLGSALGLELRVHSRIGLWVSYGVGLAVSYGVWGSGLSSDLALRWELCGQESGVGAQCWGLGLGLIVASSSRARL